MSKPLPPDPKTELYRLAPSHIKNTKLYADRCHQIAELDMLKDGKVIAEVGVAHGNFSEILIKTLNPREFVAFDLFEIHTWPHLWGMNPAELFSNRTHLEYYKDRLAKYNVVKTEVGPSAQMLSKYPDEYFDMIYIDADHTYKAVREDSLAAHDKLKKGGIMIFNDYIVYNYLSGENYGVVQAANQLIVEKNYEVAGLAISHDMFFDIAARKPE